MATQQNLCSDLESLVQEKEETSGRDELMPPAPRRLTALKALFLIGVMVMVVVLAMMHACKAPMPSQTQHVEKTVALDEIGFKDTQTSWDLAESHEVRYDIESPDKLKFEYSYGTSISGTATAELSDAWAEAIGSHLSISQTQTQQQMTKKTVKHKVPPGKKICLWVKKKVADMKPCLSPNEQFTHDASIGTYAGASAGSGGHDVKDTGCEGNACIFGASMGAAFGAVVGSAHAGLSALSGGGAACVWKHIEAFPGETATTMARFGHSCPRP